GLQKWKVFHDPARHECASQSHGEHDQQKQNNQFAGWIHSLTCATCFVSTPPRRIRFSLQPTDQANRGRQGSESALFTKKKGNQVGKKLKGPRHWLCPSCLLLRGSLQRGGMHRRDPLM